jgi:segregation and condensation protein A
MLGPDQPVVEVDGFSGPFNLLVRLVERRQLSLLAISLAEVTDQYLASLSAANLRDPEHLSAFLVVAAKLLLLKSTLLLPARERPPTSEEATPDPTDLTERLRVYAAYRAVATALGARFDAGLRSYSHPPVAYHPSVRSSPKPLDPVILTEAFRRALARLRQTDSTELPSEERMTVEEAMGLLRHALDRYLTVPFSDLIEEGATRQHRVAVFLAMLELARLGVAIVEQPTRFGPITLSRGAAVPVVDEAAMATLAENKS